MKTITPYIVAKYNVKPVLTKQSDFIEEGYLIWSDFIINTSVDMVVDKIEEIAEEYGVEYLNINDQNRNCRQELYDELDFAKPHKVKNILQKHFEFKQSTLL